MVADSRLRQLALPELAGQCDHETALFFDGQTSDCPCCLELFWRALEDGDREAWEAIYQKYAPLITSWVSRHPGFLAAAEETQYFVNQAFERLWAAWAPGKYARFRNLRALLAYLKMCVHAAIVDTTRRAGPTPAELPAELRETGLSEEDLLSEPAGREAGGSTEGEFLAREKSARLWEVVQTRLANDRERTVVNCLFVLGLKPRAVHARYPDQFPDTREIYRIRQNVLERLSRDPELQALAGEHA